MSSWYRIHEWYGQMVIVISIGQGFSPNDFSSWSKADLLTGSSSSSTYIRSKCNLLLLLLKPLTFHRKSCGIGMGILTLGNDILYTDI